MIIEMASSIIGAEMEGSDHMMYALINLMDKNLFSLHEFKTHEIDTKLSNFFMVSNYYQSIAICDFLISFYDHGNTTADRDGSLPSRTGQINCHVRRDFRRLQSVCCLGLLQGDDRYAARSSS